MSQEVPAYAALAARRLLQVESSGGRGGEGEGRGGTTLGRTESFRTHYSGLAVRLLGTFNLEGDSGTKVLLTS